MPTLGIQSEQKSTRFRRPGTWPMAIWRATGNWRGLEGEWRQESDKGVTLKKTTGPGTLGDFIDQNFQKKKHILELINLKVEFVDD